MATRFFGTGGSNAQAGSSYATRWLTPTYALANISGGDTLYVTAGTYDYNFLASIPSGSSGAPTIIAAYPGDVVWFTPSSNHWVVYFNGESYITLDGINCNGANVDDVSMLTEDRVSDMISAGHHLIVKNCEIFQRDNLGGGNTASAVYVTGHDNLYLNNVVHGIGGPYGFYVHGTDNVIDGNDIYAVATAGVHVYHNSGPSPLRTIIRNNIIRDITYSDQFGVESDRLWGILTYNATDTLIYNNRIYNNALAAGYVVGQSGIAIGPGDGQKIYNNTIYGNAATAVLISTSTNTIIRNNIFFSNTVNAISDGGTGSVADHNLAADPSFVNAAGGDFQLALGSTAIDAGATIAAVPTDCIGIARPQGAAYCIGAFEFIPPTGETAWTPLTTVSATGDASFNFAQSTGINTTGADLIVIALARYVGYSPDVTVSDFFGNPWLPLTRQDSSGSCASQLYYCIRPTVGTGHTFRAESAGDIFPSFVVWAWSTLGLPVFGAQNGAVAAPGVATIQPGSVTPTEDDCLIVSGFANIVSAGPTTVNLGFSATNVPAAGDYAGGALGSLILGTAAAKNPTWSSATDGYGFAATIAWFRVQGFGGSALTQFRRRR